MATFFQKTVPLLALGLGGGGAAYLVDNTMDANAAEHLHPPYYPWEFSKLFKVNDSASIRRGFQVYREVCAACHSVPYIRWRHLENVAHTKEELTAMAAETEVQDGPDDSGKMFMRPGKINDYLPAPYKNDQEARVANGGAVPPPLSQIIYSKEREADYVFSLLTGYSDPPPGVKVKGDVHYNRYFPGGTLAMARSLYDGMVEYDDGTPATTSQMAHDVCSFLCWTTSPKYDQDKLLALKVIMLAAVVLPSFFYLKRHRWSYYKTRRFIYKPPKE